MAGAAPPDSDRSQEQKTVSKAPIYALILLFAAAAGGQTPNPADPFVQRRTAAEAATGGHRAKMLVELARDEMEAANQAFTDGDADKGQKLAAAAAQDAEHSSEASAGSGKRLKETEIDLRKLQTRTRDIARSLALDDRPVLEKIVTQIEQFRQALLDRMFGDNKKKDKPKP
jgi:hypothetical protein